MAKPPLTVVCWKWGRRYSAGHVNKLYRSLERHLHVPFTMLCLSDRPDYKVKKPVQVIPGWPNHWGKHGCWRRLFIFSKQCRSLIGPRHLSIDLDQVIFDDITPLVDRHEDFVIYKSTNPNWPKHLYSGTMWLMNTGKLDYVWVEFQKEVKRKRGHMGRVLKSLRARGHNGTDSAWISYQLGPGVPTWGEEDGIYSFVYDLQGKGKIYPPDNTRIVLFHGRQNDQSNPEYQEKYPWIKEHWY